MSFVEDVQTVYSDALSNVEPGAECLTLTLARMKNGVPVAFLDVVIPRGAMMQMCEQITLAMQPLMVC